MRVAYITPSKLEAYRRFVQDERGTTEQLLATIRGDREWSPALDLGAGFHLTLERGPEQYWDEVAGCYIITSRQLAGPMCFTLEQMSLVLRYRSRYAGMTHEAPFTWATEVDGQPVRYRMRVDGLYGLEVHEHKTTSQPAFNVEQYERSVQWRLYLLASQAQVCQYNLFRFDTSQPGPARVEATVARMYPYAGMRADIEQLSSDYLDFVHRYELQDYVYRAA